MNISLHMTKEVYQRQAEVPGVTREICKINEF